MFEEAGRRTSLEGSTVGPATCARRGLGPHSLLAPSERSFMMAPEARGRISLYSRTPKAFGLQVRSTMLSTRPVKGVRFLWSRWELVSNTGRGISSSSQEDACRHAAVLTLVLRELLREGD